MGCDFLCDPKSPVLLKVSFVLGSLGLPRAQPHSSCFVPENAHVGQVTTRYSRVFTKSCKEANGIQLKTWYICVTRKLGSKQAPVGPNVDFHLASHLFPLGADLPEPGRLPHSPS